MPEENIIYVKNPNKVGKVEFQSKYGLLHLEVKKNKGSQMYVAIIEGRDKGITKGSAVDAWGWIGEYLGYEIYQEAPVSKIKPKRKRKVYK